MPSRHGKSRGPEALSLRGDFQGVSTTSRSRLSFATISGDIPVVNRREFLTAMAAAAFSSKGHALAPFPVKFRQQPPYAAVLAYVEAGTDEFTGEKTAVEIEARLSACVQSGDMPCTVDSRGASPMPKEYRDIAPGVAEAIYGGPTASLPAGRSGGNRSVKSEAPDSIPCPEMSSATKSAAALNVSSTAPGLGNAPGKTAGWRAWNLSRRP